MPAANQPPTIPPGKRDVDQDYRESMLSRLMNTITEALGRPLRFLEGYKPPLKSEGIKKYGGSSKFSDLENWLATVAYRYALLKFGGEDHDTDRVRVLTLAEYLEGDALTWYTAHVLSAKRTIMEWSFCDVVTRLYDRYILPTSMQDAREGFRKVRYTTALGIQGFYDALLEHAQNMVVYPDNYTILEEFMTGIPPATLTRCFRDHRLTAEVNSLDDWVGAAKEIERCDRTEAYYKERSKHRTPTSTTPTTSKPATRPTVTPKRGGFKQWAPKKEKDDEPSPIHQFARARETQKGRTTRIARGGKQDVPRTAPHRDKRCFNCNEAGHYAGDCPHPKKTREFVRAARTSAGNDDDEGKEEEREPLESDYSHQSNADRSDDNEEQAEAYEIEVPASDFYEDVTADPEFVASLHAFPLRELGNNAGLISLAQRTGDDLGQPRTVAEGSKDNTSPNLKTTKYRFQHTGKTRLRPIVS